MSKIITITVPEDVKTMAQKANVERDARRDILVYIMSNSDITVRQDQIDRYQKEYEEKYFAFEQAKNFIEKEYVIPATDGKASNWSLDYATSVVTITIADE